LISLEFAHGRLRYRAEDAVNAITHRTEPAKIVAGCLKLALQGGDGAAGRAVGHAAAQGWHLLYWWWSTRCLRR
jgi:hypothetical protein